MKKKAQQSCFVFGFGVCVSAEFTFLLQDNYEVLFSHPSDVFKRTYSASLWWHRMWECGEREHIELREWESRAFFVFWMNEIFL